MIRGNLGLFMDDDPCDGQLGVLPPRLAERRGQSLQRRHSVRTGTQQRSWLQGSHMTGRGTAGATWSWSMSVSPEITILFSILVSDMVPFSVWGQRRDCSHWSCVPQVGGRRSGRGQRSLLGSYLGDVGGGGGVGGLSSEGLGAQQDTGRRVHVALKGPKVEVTSRSPAASVS